VKEKKFTPLTTKINSYLVTILFVGIGVTTFWLARDLFVTLNEDSERSLLIQTEILYQAIENTMLAGNADMAVDFFESIQADIPQFEVTLYRNDGIPAFSDSTTIEMVNKNLGTPRFDRENTRLSPNMLPNAVGFDQALSQVPEPVFFREQGDQNTHIRLYRAFLNLPSKCVVCHGPLPTIRGVLDIRTNISDLVETQQTAMFRSLVLFLTMLGLMTILLTNYMRRSVILPVRLVGDVCQRVTRGDFTTRVQEISNDEIGLLSQRVNSMVEGLHERFELAKFVSSTTIKNLHTKKEGQKVHSTLLFSDIRGFTSYSDNHPPEKVVKLLNKILTIQTDIIHQYKGDIDKYVGDEIVAVFTGHQGELRACQAALAIQKTLKSSQSQLDHLTVGIGINSGPAIMGMVGSEKRADFTSIGGVVNVASRLCSAAKSQQILITQNLFQKVSEDFSFKGPFLLEVKGIKKSLKIYLLEDHHG